ncbi:MAG TPA: helix-turn-helix transcriptional regulator [Methylomusa anaerophila]|uniref:PBP superfamily domain protein n=1 Tax=Methylomusa anaerophila TaxID=1930071 RepID=A0A348AFE1_9FIRM|nr:helix-turn-helix transcriptional regulator [Methylomusa anaerophila]BBB89789.1 PBP superfamily domain protein [Methylomusa anaerophila]HML89165.1 helix-turn-helix transcriptional regulator [Methylomusa anaerophila]
MADKDLYTPEEVAKTLRISRFTVYELIKRGELPAYRIGRSMRIEAVELEKYIQNSKQALTSAAPNSVAHSQDFSAPSGLILCGQDAVLDVLASQLESRLQGNRVFRRFIGSIGSLIALYNQTVNVATAHLWDSDSDEYNIPYVRRYLPGQKARIVNLVYRMEGFYVALGNPKGIADWSDLTRPDVRFINREPGAGARVLLDEKLRRLNIDSSLIKGYNRKEMSHLAVASCVARDDADAGIGTEKAAMQVANVQFVPLQKERYDLVMLRQDVDNPEFKLMMSILRSAEFRREVDGMGGYDTSLMGEIVADV